MRRRAHCAKRLQVEQLENRHLLAANILVVWSPIANQPDDQALFNALIAAGNTIDADSGAVSPPARRLPRNLPTST